VGASFENGRDFVRREARVLEQRLFATLFEGAPPAGVARALEAYRNDDGGFGHGLEPDTRCPASQPMDVALALARLDEAGADARPFLDGACAFLAGVADERGAVPLALPSALAYPHAEHMAGDWAYEPSVWATASVAGELLGHGAQHPWLDRATAFCLDSLEREPPGDAHEINGVLTFLDRAPDRARAEPLRAAAAAALPGASYYLADAASDEYGVTPLHLAPTPDSPARELFSDEQIAAHLDRLEADQQPDGGWPIRWDPPSDASRLEWRGSVTVDALRTLRAYGRL
jgi:hypothetical protein